MFVRPSYLDGIMFLLISRFRVGLIFYLLNTSLLFGQIGIERQQTAGTVLLGGALNPRARRADDRGPVERGRKLSHLTLVFKRSAEQTAALDRFLGELQDHSFPNYHKWLTPEDFGKRFGAKLTISTRLRHG